MIRFAWIFIVGMSITASASTIREKTVAAIDSTRIFPTVLRELVVGYVDNSKLVPRKPLKVPETPILALQSVGDYVACGDDQGDIHLLDVDSGKIIHKFAGNNFSRIISLSSLPDSRFASGSTNGDIAIWDMKTKNRTHLLRNIREEVTCLAAHGDNLLVALTRTGYRELWDIEKRQRLTRFKSGTYASLCPLQSEELLLGHNDGIITRWTTRDLLDPRLKYAPTENSTTCVQNIIGIARSPKGKLAVSCKRGPNVITVEIWDSVTKKYLQTLRMQERLPRIILNITTGAAWLPDERLILLGLHNQIGIYEVSMEEQLQNIKLPCGKNPLRDASGPKALTVIGDHVVASNSVGELVILDSIVDILDP